MRNKIFIKVISIIIVVFLLTTSLFNGFSYAVPAISSDQLILSDNSFLKDFNINENVISYDLGKITSAINCNSDTVVVNIQDFHCNPSVQKNIKNIISFFVKKYKIKTVYVEGGYGKINTNWLSDIKDENIRTQLIKVLLENGSLTGAEYFSATNPLSHVNIYGIERENVYKENFKRLQNIFLNKKKYEYITKLFEKDLIFLQDKYFNKENKKFNNILKKYKNGKIEARKFYKILFKYVQKYGTPADSIYGTLLPIKIKDYPNIYTYIMLSEYEKNISFSKVILELKKILTILKSSVSYEQYSQLIKNTNNLQNITELVFILNNFPEEFKTANISLEMKNFINYVEISKQINPIKLVEEERVLVENLRLALAKNEAELDISFLSDFFYYFTDYINASITANNYKYFSSKFDKFQNLWDKYTYYNQISKYKEEFDILDAYYKTNVQRDYLFLENIKKTNSLVSGTKGKVDKDYVDILEKAKNIILVVTGGFHSEGFENIITKNDISYMVITPNIKGNGDFANKRYATLVRTPLLDITKQAFQLPLLSNGERLNLVCEGIKHVDIKPTPENIEILNTTANEILSNLTGRNTKYTDMFFETDDGKINVTKFVFFDMQNLLKLVMKKQADFVNPKNYADETFSFMKLFTSDSNGMIWAIAQLPPNIVEQLKTIGYDEHLPNFLQIAYCNIGKKILENKKTVKNEYKLSVDNNPFMIKFPNGKVIEIFSEVKNLILSDGDETYYIIDENFSWNNPKELKKRNLQNELVKYFEEQNYTKDDNGESVIRVETRINDRNRDEIFIVANDDVEFISLKDSSDNLLSENNPSYLSNKPNTDLKNILNELNVDVSDTIINAVDIDDLNILKDNQVVFMCLQDYSDAKRERKQKIEEYVKYSLINEKPIIIYPNIYVNNNELSNADLNLLFEILAKDFVDFTRFYAENLTSYLMKTMEFDNANETIKDIFNHDLQELLSYSLNEILKNTFVHGNLSELNKPIVINFDNNNLKIDVLNIKTEGKESIYKKLLTFSSYLRGYGKGVSNIKKLFNEFREKNDKFIKNDNFQYSDNFEDKNRIVSRASLNLRQKKDSDEKSSEYNNPDILYVGKAARLVIEVPNKAPDTLLVTPYDYYRDFALEYEGTVAKNIDTYDHIDIREYGLKAEFDGEVLTLSKAENYIEGTKVFGIEYIPTTDEDEIKKINEFVDDFDDALNKEENKRILKDLGIDVAKKESYETIHLYDFVAKADDDGFFDEDDGKMKISEDKIDAMDAKIKKCIENDIPLVVFPYLFEDRIEEMIKNEDYTNLYKLFDDLSSNLRWFDNSYSQNFLSDKQTERELKRNFRIAIQESLKNAIIHGNGSFYQLPVVIKTNKEKSQVEILNKNNPKRKNNIIAQHLSSSNWSGFGNGVNLMYQMYSHDNNGLVLYSDNVYNNDLRTPSDSVWSARIKLTTADTEIEEQNNISKEEKNKRTKKLIRNRNLLENEIKRRIKFMLDTEINGFTVEDIYEAFIDIDNMTDEEIKNFLFGTKDAFIILLFHNLKNKRGNYYKKFSFVIEQQNKTLVINFNENGLFNILEIGKKDMNVKQTDSLNDNDIKNIKHIHMFDKYNYKYGNLYDARQRSFLSFLDKYSKEEENRRIKFFNSLILKENDELIKRFGFDSDQTDIFLLDYLEDNDRNRDKYISNMIEKLYAGNLIAVYPPFTGIREKDEKYFENKTIIYSKIKKHFEKFASLFAKQLTEKNSNIQISEDILFKMLQNSFFYGNSDIVFYMDKPIFFPMFLYLKNGQLHVVNTVDKDIDLTKKTAQIMADFAFDEKFEDKLIKFSDDRNIYDDSLQLFQSSKNKDKESSLSKIWESFLEKIPAYSFLVSDTTYKYINYEFVDDVKDVVKRNKENNNSKTLTVRIINKDIDDELYMNNMKLVNSGLKINGEIVWIIDNDNKKVLIVYAKGQNYDEILPIVKTIASRTKQTNKVMEFCVDIRKDAPNFTKIAGIDAISNSFYNELKENNMSDDKIASAIKDVNIMEQKTNVFYSVSKGTSLFLEYEIKDDAVYDNFINKVLSENLGFGYVVNAEDLDNNLKKELNKAKQKGVIVYIRYSSDITQEQIKEMKQFASGYIDKFSKGHSFDYLQKESIVFTEINGFKNIENLEKQIESCVNVPLIKAAELLVLVEGERFTDKLAMLNKLTKMLFAKKEYTEDYIKCLANNINERVLKEIESQIEKKEDMNNIIEIVSQHPVIKIIFEKIETNSLNEAQKFKNLYIKTVAMRTLLYFLAKDKNIKKEHLKDITNIGNIFDELTELDLLNIINMKDKKIKLTSKEKKDVDNIKQEINSGKISVESLLNGREFNATTKMEYVLTYLIDDNPEINSDETDFDSMVAIKALLSAA